jgi:hypothetical protein
MILTEDWSVKGKFPTELKPLLGQVALKAIVLGEYDDNFFNLMPKIFPYNRFTMQKLIKRTIWRDHTNLLVERQNVLLEELGRLAQEGFHKAQEEWERSVSMWGSYFPSLPLRGILTQYAERRQTVRTETLDGSGQAQPPSAEGTPIPSSTQPTPLLSTSALPQAKSIDDSGDMDIDDAQILTANGKLGAQTAKDVHPPPKRYRLTDQMKTLIWQLVCLSNECCRIENEKK